jgi:hypothetical protein
MKKMFFLSFRKYTAGALHNPNGITLYSYVSNLLMNAVFSLSYSAI